MSINRPESFFLTHVQRADVLDVVLQLMDSRQDFKSLEDRAILHILGTIHLSARGPLIS